MATINFDEFEEFIEFCLECRNANGFFDKLKLGCYNDIIEFMIFSVIVVILIYLVVNFFVHKKRSM